VRGGDVDGLLEAVALEEAEPADRLLRLGERAVGHESLACRARVTSLANWQQKGPASTALLSN
jgi:hypothetical protein